MTIAWTHDLTTGVEAIDADHRRLYETVARLHALMRRHALHEVEGVLDDLAAYAAAHFGTEEREMAATGYPELAAHRDAHLAFLAEFVRMRGALSPVPTTSGVVELSSWLGDWLREHVRGVDGDMARWLLSRPAPLHRPAA